MFYINKVSSNSVVDFAAEEMRKYLRMMMPEGGDVRITFDPSAKEGFRLGFMQDFSLDVSDAKDTELDDIIYIESDQNGGIIAGDNPRSVLIAVYEYFRQNGCRWLFPGIDGEYIPLKSVRPVSYRHRASCRYRGPCIEGATSQRSILDMIEFIPKVGMNLFMSQFLNPTTFYNRYYNRELNTSVAPESVTNEQILQWKCAFEAELSKRGIQFHDVGHGWTSAPFGVDISKGWGKLCESEVPEKARPYLAMLGGERKLDKGIAINTQFCMSNPSARKIVAEYIADYADVHSNVDYIHVWLADGWRNHCECDECVKKLPTDWYIMLLNDIDKALTAKGLGTRIVFIAYHETIWAPREARIENPDRFCLMLAPISRNYTRTLSDNAQPQMLPFVLNQCQPPVELDEFLTYFKEWKKVWHGSNLCYEYHFWKHQMFDVSGLVLAKRIFEDVDVYLENDINGLIACGSLRSFFPNGFAYYVFARKQYDASFTYEELLEDYYSHAHGEDWREFAAYLRELGEAVGFAYLEAKESADMEKGLYYNPERAKRLRGVPGIVEKGMKLVKEHYQSSDRVRTVSVRLLEYHVEYVAALAKVFALKADGKNKEASETMFGELFPLMSKNANVLESYFDTELCRSHIYGIIGRATGV
jgi:hypothetical protein